MSVFARYFRNDPLMPTWRLALEREPGELTMLAEEETTSTNERTCQPIERNPIWLTMSEVRWLHAQLGELVAELDAEASEIAARTPSRDCPTHGGAMAADDDGCCELTQDKIEP